MKKPPVNNFSWYAISEYKNVDSEKLTRINLKKSIQIRYDLDNKNVVVIRHSLIEKNVGRKIDKVARLKDKLKKIKTNNLSELKKLLNIEKSFIFKTLE